MYFCGIKIASYEKSKPNIRGTGNIIRINKSSNITLTIYGNNNTVIVDNKECLDNFNITIGIPDCLCNNCIIRIGNNFSSNGANMLVLEDNTVIEIGNDCMFSSNITFWPSDTHTITDTDGNITNIGKYIKIGNDYYKTYMYVSD